MVFTRPPPPLLSPWAGLGGGEGGALGPPLPHLVALPSALAVVAAVVLPLHCIAVTAR